MRNMESAWSLLSLGIFLLQVPLYLPIHEELPEDDILTEVPYQEWPSLRDVFLKDWPFAIHVYYLIQNYIQWKRKDSQVPCTIYCPDGRYDDGTIIVETYKNSLFVFTLQKDCTRLTEALRSTRRLPLVCATWLHAVNNRHWPHVRQALGSITEGATIPSSYHWIPREEAAAFQYEVPEDVYIAKLSEEHIPIMNELWPHRFPGSEVYLRHAITLSEGLGVFRKEDGSIVSWILRNQYLGLGVLQTLEQHKRKGYATLLIKAMSKRMGLEGIDVHTFIVATNFPSLKIFKACSFRHIDNLTFSQLIPL